MHGDSMKSELGFQVVDTRFIDRFLFSVYGVELLSSSGVMPFDSDGRIDYEAKFRLSVLKPTNQRVIILTRENNPSHAHCKKSYGALIEIEWGH